MDVQTQHPWPIPFCFACVVDLSLLNTSTPSLNMHEIIGWMRDDSGHGCDPSRKWVGLHMTTSKIVGDGHTFINLIGTRPAYADLERKIRIAAQHNPFGVGTNGLSCGSI